MHAGQAGTLQGPVPFMPDDESPAYHSLQVPAHVCPDAAQLCPQCYPTSLHPTLTLPLSHSAHDPQLDLSAQMFTQYPSYRMLNFQVGANLVVVQGMSHGHASLVCLPLP